MNEYLAAVHRKTIELWVVKNRSLSKFYRIFSDLVTLIFEFGWMQLFRLLIRTRRIYLLPILRTWAKISI